MILLDASLRITVVALLVAVILAALRVRSSEVRHRTWAGVLVAMLLMPILPSLVPGIPLPIQLKPPALAGASQPAWTSAVNELPGLKPGPSTEGLTNLTPGIGQTIRFLPGESPVTVETQQTSMWWRVVAVTYLIGVVTLLVRMAAGWRAVGGLVRGARRTTLSHEIPVYESELVATPVTVGFAPSRIILPREWSRWPDHKLRACLAHETAHVRRRDPLTALIARVNTCIFWFHPLAWWLERTLAVSAEHAADAAAVRAIGNTRQYADVLLDIANSVRMHGSRVAWQGVGVDGTGLLGRRIDRLVRGDVDVALSRLRTGILFATCAIAVALVVACQQQPAAVAPLTPDPEVAARLERQRANEAFYKSAANMTAAEVDALERSLKRTPEDFESLRKLQQFYRSGSGQKVFGWNEMIARRRPHLLWLIENHPDHDLAAWTVSATSDPVGYAEAKKRWLAQVAKPDASEKTLLNAAHFFDRYDPRSAEELLIRAEAFRELGVFYAGIVNGYTSGGNPVRRPDDDEYQKIALQRLLTSDNAAMVGAASDRLGFGIRNQADRDRAAQVLRRALALDPKRERARELLDSFERQEQEAGLNESLHRRGLELAGKEIAAKIEQRQALTDVEKATLQQARERAFAELPEAERFARLPGRADVEYQMAEYAGSIQDSAREKSTYARSKQYATEALALAPKFREHADYGAHVYLATVTLAAHALREGNRAEAVRLMGEASAAPASNGFFRLMYGGIDQRLVNYLLKAGERESVAEFLEKSAALRPRDRERLLKDAAAIRAGKMPLSYQHMLSRQ